MKENKIDNTQEMTLGKSWKIAIFSLSFGLFFFWLPPLMIILFIVAAIFLPISILWTIFRILGISEEKLRNKSGFWRRYYTHLVKYKKK